LSDFVDSPVVETGGRQAVVTSTEIGTPAEIESKPTQSSGPTLHDLAQLVGRGVAEDAGRHPDVGEPVAEVGVGAHGAFDVEVALK
jgi:hypothetical protein